MAFPFSHYLTIAKSLLSGLLLTIALSPVSAAICDLDGDGVVTRADLATILQARNRPVITPFDPLDIDRNGVINSNDARRCVCKLDTTEACKIEPNQPPKAAAGTNQTIEQATAITLNGRGSVDPEGDRLSYRWQFEQRPAGSQAVLSSADSANPAFVPDRPGEYRITLTVTDAFGLSNTGQVTVVLQPPVVEPPVVEPPVVEPPVVEPPVVEPPVVEPPVVEPPVVEPPVVEPPVVEPPVVEPPVVEPPVVEPPVVEPPVVEPPVVEPPVVEPPVNLVAVADSNATQVGKAAVSSNVISNDALNNAEVLVTEITHNGQSFTPGIAFTTGAGSSLQLQADGNYTYLPSDQALETAVNEVFTYTIRAANGATSQATLTIRLTPANKLPLAVADVAATEAGGSSVSGNVTSNDNLGNTPTTVTAISLPTTPHGGAFTLQEDGSYTYTPPATLNSAVEEIFTYTLKDHDGETSTATLTIKVTTNNQLPEAKADNRITEAAATAIIGNVLSNDRLGNTPTNVTLLMHDDRLQPFGETFDTVHGGWFRLFEDGRYMYVMPEAGSISSVVKEAFTYTIEDVDGESSTATLTVQVFPTVTTDPTPCNEPNNQVVKKIELCLAIDGSASISSSDFQLQLEGIAQSVEDPTVIPHNGSISLSIVQFSSSARLEVPLSSIDSLATANSLANQVRGISQINFGTNIGSGISLCQQSGLNASNAFSASVKQVIDVSTDGQDNTSGFISDAAVSAGVDAINAIGVGTGVDVLQLNDLARPQPVSTQASGSDGFVVLVRNFNEFITAIRNKIRTETAIVTTPEQCNHSPLARPDNFEITAVDNDTTPHTGDNVLANDDLGDEPTVVTPVSIQLTQHGGAFQLRADGTYSYITPAVVTGVLQEIFPYTITDIDNDISSATLTIHVAPPNRSPLARADENNATAGGPAVTGNVLNNDDLGNKPALVTPISTSPPFFSGIFELQTNGDYVYTPPTSLSGVIVEGFTYTLTDQDGETSTATVTIMVSPDDRVVLGQGPLEQCIRDELGLSSVDQPTRRQLGFITSLHCLVQGITDISALSNLTALTNLGLWSNTLTDISVLSNLTALTHLDLHNNKLTDISTLSNLTALTNLDLGNNQLTDVGALSNLTALTNLRLHDNQLTNIGALSNLTSLTELTLGHNQLTDISVLSNLTTLTSLDLSNNQFTDINVLSNLTALTKLFLVKNQLTDISALSNLTALTALLLHDNQLTDINVLSNLTALRELTLYNNQLTDISALSNLTTLTRLNVYNNQLTDINALSNLIALTRLDLNNNQLTNISGLSNLTALTRLNVYNNQLTDISALSNLTTLLELRLHNNQLTDINALSNLTTLTILVLNNNQLTNISALSNLTALTALLLENNQLTDISALSNLLTSTDLRLDSNHITDFTPVNHVQNVTGRNNQTPIP